METFQMGCEEEGCFVEFGKGVGGFDDGVAEGFEDGLVERGEDGVLEDYFLDGVGFAWWVSWISFESSAPRVSLGGDHRGYCRVLVCLVGD